MRSSLLAFGLLDGFPAVLSLPERSLSIVGSARFRVLERNQLRQAGRRRTWYNAWMAGPKAATRMV